MASVASLLHKLSVRCLLYLDDWLFLSDSEKGALDSRALALSLCQDLGIRLNMEKSCLNPSQSLTFLGMRICSVTLKAS
ncbi:reverse transcriptase domain-containing protein, partial [Klebsiella pneumoniae]|uniref:reverse transcriptase domain-containing protein n=1 Tax=Klebsiella pneumoniae TaxID=573 RepID=UPI003EB6F02C